MSDKKRINNNEKKSTTEEKKRKVEDDHDNKNQTIDQKNQQQMIGPSKGMMTNNNEKKLEFEKLYLERLPNAKMYERSYMHRENVTHICVSSTEFIITGSRDGHLKFWKKESLGIDFVKHYIAHMAPLNSISCSVDGLTLATTSDDQSIKIFDVINFDMINMIETKYVPNASCWIHTKGNEKRLVVSEKEGNNIYVYNQESKEPIKVLSFHNKPVHLIYFNHQFDCVVSVDQGGMLEYWSPSTFTFPDKHIQFKLKSATDLYHFAKQKAIPESLSFSHDGKKFVITSSNKQVLVFNFLTGKLRFSIDESLSVYQEAQKDDNSIFKVELIDFGRRVALEKELNKNSLAQSSNALFDESGNFLIYPTIMGIKVVNVKTGKLSRILGGTENIRFFCLALFQGKSEGSFYRGDRQKNAKEDPSLFACALNQKRFYFFTRREPNMEDDELTGRDIFNEKPSKEEQTTNASKQKGNIVTLHTTKGDIKIQLFPEECPKTVNNFLTHAKNGYYNELIFHRVIRGFMIQTGDPLGDGTGGESIYGSDFEDEFSPKLRHSRPGMVSMANTGHPNTNGSQFFITTQPISRLDNKHTIFGTVIAHMDTVFTIEQIPTDKGDRPREEIKIISITIEN